MEAAAALCDELGHAVEPFQPEVDGALFQRANLVCWATNNLLSLARALDVRRSLVDHPALEWITGRIAEEAKRFSALDYMVARQQMHTLSRSVAAPFARFDLLLSPVVKEPPWELGVYETGFTTPAEYFARVYDYSPFCWPYNVSGQPAVSVPFHTTDGGLPVGVMFAARYGEEATLLRIAAQIEASRPWKRRYPPMLASGPERIRPSRAQGD